MVTRPYVPAIIKMDPDRDTDQGGSPPARAEGGADGANRFLRSPDPEGALTALGACQGSRPSAAPRGLGPQTSSATLQRVP